MKEKPKVVIAEDHKVLRQGLRSLLEVGGELDVVSEAGDGMEAIRCVREHEPDLLILDLNMPRMDGISAVMDIRKACPSTRILALTMHKDEDHVLQAFKAGIHGYCLKSSDQEELQLAIRSVLSGKQFVSPEISGRILEGYLTSTRRVREKSSWETLTQREREILKMVGEGYQNKEIADTFSISVKTVEKHRANIMEKLDLHTASSLTAYAIEKGLVTA